MKICPEATIQPAAQPGQPRRPALAAARTHPVSQPHSFLAFFYVLFYVVFSKCDIDVHNIQRRHLILIARPPRQQKSYFKEHPKCKLEILCLNDHFGCDSGPISPNVRLSRYGSDEMRE